MDRLRASPEPRRGRVVEYSVTSHKYVIRVLDEAGEVLEAHVHENSKTRCERLPLEGAHSMRSIAKHHVGLLCARHGVSMVRKVNAYYPVV